MDNTEPKKSEKSDKEKIKSKEIKKSRKENSNAPRECVKFLVTFLKDTVLRGVVYKKGDSVELLEGDPKLSSKRTDIKVTRLDG